MILPGPSIFPLSASRVAAAAVGGPGGGLPVGGAALWLAADAITGLSDGASVSTWPDGSGNGYSATQSGAARPTYKTSILNGKPIVRFDGAATWMSLSGSFACRTTYVVFKTNGFTDYDGIVAYRASPNSIKVAASNESGQITGKPFNLSAVNDSGIASDVYVNGVQRLLSDYQNFSIGVPISSGWNFLTDYKSTSASGTKNIVIGADAYGSGGAPRILNGDIAEIVIYPTAHSSTDRASVEGYLTTKYAL